MTLAWKDNSFYEEGFEVERALGAGAFERVAMLANGARAFADGGLAAATYRYRVRAFNDAGSSPWAGPVEATVVVEGPEISRGSRACRSRRMGRSFPPGFAAGPGLLSMPALPAGGTPRYRPRAAFPPQGHRGRCIIRPFVSS